MTDWEFGQEEPAIRDLVEEKEYKPDYSYVGDFEAYFTIGGDPICLDCFECMSPQATYVEEDCDAEQVGTCYECGGLL
jgi:hypothetical protein